ncbi:hypothetical protein I317_01023 [Kwoniella heveanensis CBS 569]|uniref:Velvet domain-containing protein n=1 Tax=Kwoniella heveanensis BCC8398 TaxID=1296120 RepID=A0A1B9GYQ4_9TREE|nr:hypothetical protein I316_02012 [Kwoniella heveanensis BCC8398]OCF45220.1 hypothetical protein I317_01023 [Kwoniella heveanensis CBS 569]
MYPPPPPPPQSSRSSTRSTTTVNSTSSSDASARSSSTATPDWRTRVESVRAQGSDSAGSRSDESSRTPTLDVRHNVGVEDVDGLTWVFTPPVLVEHGMFKGRWLRFALAVAQEPVLGRRKTEKDRRPLGPAPIVRFRAVECRRRRSEPGDWNEEEVDPSAIEPSHLICAAELAPPLSSVSASFSADRSRPTSSTAVGDKQASTDAGGDVIMSERPISMPITEYVRDGDLREDSEGEDVDDVAMMEDDERMEFMVPSPRKSDNGLGHDSSNRDVAQSTSLDESSRLPQTERDSFTRVPEEKSDEIDKDSSSRPSSSRRLDGIVKPSSASSEAPRPTGKKKASDSTSAAASPSIKGIRNLYGSLHVAGVRVPSPEGGMGTWFLFTDLSVRQEGTYSLRFRCFDLTAVGPSVGLPSPCLVECQSQPFRVYSPRQVPPLPKPTELAEHFAKQGFKLNTRKNERTVSTPPPSAPPSASGSRTKQPGSAAVTTNAPPNAKASGVSSSTRAQSSTTSKTKKGKGKDKEAEAESESQHPAQRPHIEPIQVDSPNQSVKGSKGSNGTVSTEFSHDEGSFSTSTNSGSGSIKGTSSSTLSTMGSNILSGPAGDGAGPGVGPSGSGTGTGSGHVKTEGGNSGSQGKK